VHRPAWRSLRAIELLTAASLCVLGVAVVIATARMRVGFAAPFQPRLFPNAIGALLLMSGAALGWSAIRTPAALMVEWPDTPAARRIVVVLGSMAAYLIAIDAMGMPLATVLIVWFQVWYLGRSRPYVAIAIAVIAGLVVEVVFTRALGLMFPTGPFGR
jgi:putative tricarboxylic transport membrane protein